LGTFPAHTPPQTEDGLPQTGRLSRKTVVLQGFCLTHEVDNRALATRSPRLKGLRPRERMGLMARSGHPDIAQIAPSPEASPHNASERQTLCNPRKHIASLR
jgi:hypothetical protein